MIYLCVTPERTEKTRRLMQALHTGFARTKTDSWIVPGAPPDNDEPFVVWGQAWLTLAIVPSAVQNKRPFWHLDNGFWRPARGGVRGFYRTTYRSLSPILLDKPTYDRGRRMRMQPWRKTGKHILIALPGADFGRAMGLNCRQWIAEIEARVRMHTDRKIIVRPKKCGIPLQQHLENCWALVTHSSNVAVDAVMAGVPVFVEPTSPAAPVGRLDLDLEHPLLPEREHWLHSLMCQQFELDEMRSGVAQHWMRVIAEQVDGGRDGQAKKEAEAREWGAVQVTQA